MYIFSINGYYGAFIDTSDVYNCKYIVSLVGN